MLHFASCTVRPDRLQKKEMIKLTHFRVVRTQLANLFENILISQEINNTKMQHIHYTLHNHYFYTIVVSNIYVMVNYLFSALLLDHLMNEMCWCIK